MTDKEEKRSSSQGIAQLSLDLPATSPGVGGRHSPPPPSTKGGGYQNKCEFFKFSTAAEKKRDPRLDELREMGLQRVWLEVAEAIGVDGFLAVWRILSEDPASIGDVGRIEVAIRSFSAYQRYQRNRYIETLTAQGYTPEQIRRKLIEQTGEQISNRHILRLQKQG